MIFLAKFKDKGYTLNLLKFKKISVYQTKLFFIFKNKIYVLYLCIYLYIYTSVWLYVFIYCLVYCFIYLYGVYIYACLYIFIFIYLYACMYIYIPMYEVFHKIYILWNTSYTPALYSNNTWSSSLIARISIVFVHTLPG